jgi:hypothetical protein
LSRPTSFVLTIVIAIVIAAAVVIALATGGADLNPPCFDETSSPAWGTNFVLAATSIGPFGFGGAGFGKDSERKQASSDDSSVPIQPAVEERVITTIVPGPSGADGSGRPAQSPSQPPKSVTVAFFDRAIDTIPKVEDLRFEDLVDRLSTHSFRLEKDGPLFSPTIYAKGTSRRNDNVVALTLAVGDFDKGTVPPEKICEHLGELGLAFVIYSTFSSTSDHPKFRAVVPLLDPVPAANWGPVWGALVHELFLDLVDLGTRDASRMFYMPSAPPGTVPAVYRRKGVAFDASTLRLDPGHRRRPLTLPGETGPITKGERRPKLMSIAGRLRNAGAGYDAILAELRANNTTRCDPKLAEKDLEHIAASACKYEPGPVGKTALAPSQESRDVATESAAAGPQSEPIRVVEAGDRGRVEHFADRIEWVQERETQYGTFERRFCVIDTHLDVISRVVVDGETYFVVNQDARAVVQADALLKKLLRSGAVVDNRHARDALNLVLRDATRDKVIRANSAVGVYEDDGGRLQVCLEPVPISDSQREALEDVHAAQERLKAGGPLVPADVDAYREVEASFLPHEVLPVMGLSSMAPFALMLRRHGVMVPCSFSQSEESGLGKSTVNDCFSTDLYGIRQRSADDIESPFRLIDQADAVGLPVSVHEAEKLNAKGLGPAFKNLAERESLGTRGQPDLGHRRYSSRAVLLLSGNRNDVRTQQARVRFFVARWDPSQKSSRQKRRQDFDELRSRLRPIGLELITHTLSRFPTTVALVTELEKVRRELEAVYPGRWEDPRRSQAWAVVTLGLRLWESFAESVGAKFPAPPVADFVHDVVAPVEASTFESADFSVFAVRRRLLVWFIRNTSVVGSGDGGHIQVVRGRSRLWDHGEVGGRKGYWITADLLEELERDVPPELRPNSFADFARACAEKFGLPRGEALGGDGRGKPREMQDGTARCAFVPTDDVDPDHGVEEKREGGRDPPKSGKLVSKTNLPPQKPLTATNSGGKKEASSAEKDSLPPYRENARPPPDGHSEAKPAPVSHPAETDSTEAKVAAAAVAIRAYLSERSGGAEIQRLLDHLVERGFSPAEAEAAVGRVCGEGSVLLQGDLLILKAEGGP